MVAEKFINEEEEGFSIRDNIHIGNPTTDENTGLAKLLLDALNKNPDFVGQINVQTGENITFAEIKDRSIRCAIWLKKQGIGKNDVICISTPNQTDDYVPCLATFFLGAIFNPWYHELTPAIARHFFTTYEPKVMFACENSIEMLAKVAQEIGVNCQFVVYGRHSRFPSLRDLLAQQTQEEVENFHHVEPEEPKNQVGVIFFSSGTTGIQKGTMLSYYTLVNNRAKYSLIREGMRMLWYSSLSWITGTNFLTYCIRASTIRVIHAQFDPEETSKVIQNYKINWAFLTPTMLTQMCKAKVFTRYNFSSIERIIVGGSKPSKAILEETRKSIPNTLVVNSFGMTELGGLTVQQTKDCKRADSIGHVVNGVKMKILDNNTGHALGPNQHGELCFKFDNFMLGYFKNPEETKKMIDDEGWMHTGDNGYYDEDGEITITDRIKEVIITQNHHVSPSQIREILLQHPEVQEVAVVPVPHQVDVERPLAFVVKVPRAKVTAEELKELPTSYNEYFRLSGGVVFVNELPYTSTRKHCLKTLKEMAKAYAQ